MSDTPLSLDKLTTSQKFKIGFYDEDKKRITSTIEHDIDFSKELNEENNRLLLVNQGAFGHLGVTYTVILIVFILISSI